MEGRSQRKVPEAVLEESEKESGPEINPRFPYKGQKRGSFAELSRTLEMDHAEPSPRRPTSLARYPEEKTSFAVPGRVGWPGRVAAGTVTFQDVRLAGGFPEAGGCRVAVMGCDSDWGETETTAVRVEGSNARVS